MGLSLAARRLGRIVVGILLVDGEHQVAPVDLERNRHDGMGRGREWRVVIVGANRPWCRQVGNVDHPETGVPDARPHPVVKAQGVMQPVLAALPVRCLAAGKMLAGHPPA
jgi:hypothetical protein